MTTTTKTATKTAEPRLGLITNLEATEDTLDMALQDMERANEALADIRRHGLANATLTDTDRLEIIRQAKKLRNLAGWIIEQADNMETEALRE
jgi:hypothetical protein